MPELSILNSSGVVVATHTLPTGTLLCDALELTHTHLPYPCNKKGTCGKCSLKAAGALSPISPEETTLLGDAKLAEGYRLACRACAQGDVFVYQPSEEKSHQIQEGKNNLAVTKDALFKQYGVCIDIGTTTVAAQLYGKTGLLASTTALNPQRHWGLDVISRIEAALGGAGQELAASICACIQNSIHEMAQTAQIETAAIDYIVITGNTAMLYLLTGQNPKPLAAAPFDADCLFGIELPSASLKLDTLPHATLFLAPCFSAFVGGDIATAILASSLGDSAETSMLVDIGTNGEMALWYEGKILCCSTAAGPAFEGVGLSCGMTAKEGAIEHVALQDGALVCTVIGAVPATGLCGSGVIDALAVLLQAEVVDETGALQEQSHFFTDKIIPCQDSLSFELAPGILLTQKDIRMIQLAKSAISAGLLTLIHSAGLAVQDITRFILAGGFANYLRLQNAGEIGLIPLELLPKTHFVGNAALNGAAMILLDANHKDACLQYTQNSDTIDLASNAVFMDYYVNNMLF